MLRSLIAAAVVLAACGGGASQTTTASAPAAATAATAAPTTAAPTAAATPKAPAFGDLVGASKNATYKVTYKWTGSSQGQAVSAEQTWYVRGSQTRFDLAMPEGGISVFSLTDGAYVCTKAGGQATTCIGMAKDAALQQNQGAAFSLAIGDRPDQFDPTFEGARSIAGQPAQCFGLKDKAGISGFGDGRVCYSSGGIPLLMQSKGNGFDMTFEATAFSTTVTDADLTLPATPIKLGG